MTTDDKGDLGEIIVMAEASRKGYIPLIPISEKKRYDFVLEKNGKFIRVQVKYSEMKDGKIRVNLYHNAGKENKTKTYTDDEIDAIVVFNKETNKCYFISSAFFKGRHKLELRVDKPKRKSKKINWAKDFEW